MGKMLYILIKNSIDFFFNNKFFKGLHKDSAFFFFVLFFMIMGFLFFMRSALYVIWDFFFSKNLGIKTSQIIVESVAVSDTGKAVRDVSPFLWGNSLVVLILLLGAVFGGVLLLNFLSYGAEIPNDGLLFLGPHNNELIIHWEGHILHTENIEDALELLSLFQNGLSMLGLL
jgi:hypothetical protein